MRNTEIQWSHSTINPVMGCDGCELLPPPEQIIGRIANSLVSASGLSLRDTSTAARSVCGKRFTTEIYKDRQAVAAQIQASLKLGNSAARAVVDLIREATKCCAALQGTMRAGHKGYADIFEEPKEFPGRVAEAARWRPPGQKELANKPWLKGLRRLVFVSDMGDALSRDISFEFLQADIIEPVTTKSGGRHLWLWLTKRPGRMAQFAQWLAHRGITWPDNVVAMTTVTAKANQGRIEQLRRVPAKFKGLSIEPLFEAVSLDLQGIDWAIVGGGSDVLAKPFHVEWALDLRCQCEKQKVPFFLKQLGRNPYYKGQKLAIDDLHGGDWSEWPAEWRIRQVPDGFRAVASNLPDTTHPVANNFKKG